MNEHVKHRMMNLKVFIQSALLRATKSLLIIIFAGFCVYASAAQVNVKLTLNNSTVAQAIDKLHQQTGYVFSYDAGILSEKVQDVSIDVENERIETVLSDIFGRSDINFRVVNNRVFLKHDKNTKTEASKSGNAQQQPAGIVISGSVKDEYGEAIIGANIIVKGTTIGIITDIDGNFSITVPDENSALQISYIGYLTKEVPVGKQRTIHVSLTEDSKALDEVVVVGYGIQKKANLTGAVSTIKMDEVIEGRPIVNVGEALQGTVPGLLVTSGGNQSGTSKNFQIRGAYSVGIYNSATESYGNTIEPLVLIDNVEGDMKMINPEDIETVTVLKDASSSAIYGARAAGGVILITTKRPKGEAKFQLNYNNNFSVSNAVNFPKQASLMQYLQTYSEAAGDQFWSMGAPSVSKWMGYLEQYKANPSSIKTYGDGMFKDTDGAVYFLNEKSLAENMFETGYQMTHNISMSGGTNKVRYRLGGSYVGDDGVILTDKDTYERLTFNSFISADITDWFTQEATVGYSRSNRTVPSSALGGIYSLRLASFYPEGVMPEEISSLGAGGVQFFTPRNQILWSNPATTINDNPRVFLKSILKPFRGFEGVLEYTFDKNVYDYHWYTGSTQYTTIQDGVDTTPTAGNDYLRKYKQHTNYNSINVYGTYNFTLNDGDHDFKIMAGFNQESKYQETLDAYSYGQAVIEVPSLGGGVTRVTANDYYDDFALRSGFFRMNYNFLNKYLLEVNGRYDGSSKFPKVNRFGFFPSGSIGWQIAEEKFMASTKKWLDAFKVRASYGMIGNQNIANYTYSPTMSINNTYSNWLVNSTYVTAITSIPSLVRNNFTWEKVSTLNIGVDFALLNNRLNGLFEWYQKDTKGMLSPGMDLPAVVGADAPYQNTADMRTKGWDLSINWRDRIGKVGYRVGFNLSDYESIITKYDANDTYLISNFYKGQVLGQIWGYVFDDFYTVDDFESTSTWKLKEGVTTLNGYNPRPGDVKFKNLMDDENLGENVISSGNGTVGNPGDRKIIGNSLPRFLYGISLGVNYANFDLNIFLQGTGKRDYWLANSLSFPLYSDYKFVALYDGLTNYWKPVDEANGDYTAQNTNAYFPRIYGNYGNQGSNYRQSDKYLSDASYLRIKSVTLSYITPKRWSSRISLQQLKAFVSVENLATFTSLPSGIDPETLGWNYPLSRTISFGINFTL